MDVVEGDGKTDREGFLTFEVRLCMKGAVLLPGTTIYVLFDVIGPSGA